MAATQKINFLTLDRQAGRRKVESTTRPFGLLAEKRVNTDRQTDRQTDAETNPLVDH